MILKKDMFNDLKSLGLNTYEAKLWLALLSLGSSSAGKLSDIANVPRSRSYDVLESLEKKGFIITKLGKPIQYLAISPKEVMERLKNKIQKEHDEKQNYMDSFRSGNLMKDLEELHGRENNSVKSSEIMCSLKGRDKIYSQLNSLIKNAKESIILVSSNKGILRKIKQFKKELKNATDRGVIVSLYNCSETRLNSTLVNHLNLINLNDFDARICLVDSKDTIMMLNPDEEIKQHEDYALWLKSPFISKSINKMIFNLNN